ncbi:siderophore ABC transporter substrate-binding protein [Pararhodobacter zhoushanensis]|uniref:ABC transporter substrate-binding protein n=1 Tax=Pararhodobacter zhoushanensis TaxID=2479545 RepID=A0ABT3GV83_9RHOB|nr:ABC transporter substrate-binding protein [Pararhodobacter zhoushanensis]MCW1931430.1 ABC transporter substrate-binding protein [Pararhodobacter zhoushanensis]
MAFLHRSFAFAAALTLVTAPTLAETVTHAQGTTEIEGVPQTVLVYDSATLDNLDALEVPVAGAPAAALPGYLSQYGAPIGTMFEPDFEAVNAAEPDLVLVGGRSAPQYAALSAMVPTLDLTVPREGYVDGVAANLALLGRIFDRDAQAAALIEGLRSSVAALHAEAGDAGRVLVVLTTGGRMSAHGPGSRFAVIYDDYGFTPAVEGLDIGTHGQAISFEFIRETDPDWLFVVDRDAAIGREGQSAAAYLDNPLVQSTRAWQQGQVVYLDAQAWYLIGGGVQAMQASIAQLRDALAQAGN